MARKEKITEVPVETGDVETKEVEGLSTRDALEIAIKAQDDKEENRGDGQTEAPKPNTEVARDSTPVREGESNRESALQPPAEYTNEEKADFMQLSRKGQEAQLRLDKSRKTKIDEIRGATKELELKRKDYEDIQALADSIRPYLKANGVKDPSEVALKKAMAMWKEFEEGDPNAAAANYLRAKGKPVPKELLNGQTQPQIIQDPRISTLQEQQNALLSKISEAEHRQKVQNLNQVFDAFRQTKNASGELMYPDISDNEIGGALAAKIGTLVNDQSPLGQQFIANASERIPNLTYNQLLHEAYRFSGGRVADSESSRSQDNQKQVARSIRAASAVPGKAASSSSGTIRKFSTYREAARQAIEDLNKRDSE